jgi:putative acetyltransferase
MGRGDVTVELVPAATDEVRVLVDELERVLAAEYPPEQRHGLALDAIFQPNIRFFVARLDGAAVGCGGVAFLTGFAEVKRMYVRDAARGRGVAPALLARIEQEARDAGVALLRLETGVSQFAALRFYEREGFRPCAVFGDYATMAPQEIASSIFMEKRL